MKILLLTHYYEPEIGAPQRRWSAFVKHWTSAGHEVRVVCPPPHYPDRQAAAQWRGQYSFFKPAPGALGETVVRTPYLAHGFSGTVRLLDQLVVATCSLAWTLSAAIGGWRPDVIVATVPGLPSLLAGSAASRVIDRPLVAEFRDAWPDVVTGDMSTQVARQSLPRHLLKAAVFRSVTALQKQAATCITTTEGFATTLKKRGIKHVEVISNGAETVSFMELEHTDRGDGILRVQYLGTVGRSQGLSVLLDAVDELYQRGYREQVKLRIVGSGADLPVLQAEAARRSLDVDFQPPVPRANLQETYRWADVEIVSLKDTKPFRHTVPSKIFELLSTQRRIIGLVAGEAAMILQRSGVSTVVPPQNAQALADALEQLIGNSTELAVGTTGRYLLYNDYNYGTLSRRYLAKLERAVDRWRQGRGKHD